MEKLSQNIFHYAKSELSQDAFISLLIAWFDSDDEELREISKDFINSLYKEYTKKFSEKNDNLLNIQSIKIKQQHFKIDVYFEIECQNRDIVAFIIEDKIWTEPHSKQLKRYVKNVFNQSKKDVKKDSRRKAIDEKNIVKIRQF